MKAKKYNFKTFERIVMKNLKETKQEYYYKAFIAQKDNIKKNRKHLMNH